MKVKGTALYGRINYVKKYFGEEKLERVLSCIKDREAAERLRRGALRFEWYPFPLFVELIGAIDRVCGTGDGGLVRTMAGQIAEDDLKTVYKVFFRVASTSFILNKASQVWRQYYDSGDLIVLADEPRHVTLEIRGFATPNRLHCESVAGWVQRCVELTGQTGVTVAHPACRSAGNERCVLDIHWE